MYKKKGKLIMSPLDMLIFFFFILVTIKAAIESVKYWRDRDGRGE